MFYYFSSFLLIISLTSETIKNSHAHDTFPALPQYHRDTVTFSTHVTSYNFLIFLMSAKKSVILHIINFRPIFWIFGFGHSFGHMYIILLYTGYHLLTFQTLLFYIF